MQVYLAQVNLKAAGIMPTKIKPGNLKFQDIPTLRNNIVFININIIAELPVCRTE